MGENAERRDGPIHLLLTDIVMPGWNSRSSMARSSRRSAVLTSYGWPGNIRELRNHVERPMAMSDGPLIRTRDLAPELSAPALEAGGAFTGMQLAGRRAIVDALKAAGGHRVETAMRPMTEAPRAMYYS